MSEPPLFAGEPEHCSLCGEPGHTHDDHWLFKHEPVQALLKRIETREAEISRLNEALELQKRIGSGFSSALLPCEEAIADAAELFERWLERDGWPQGDDPLTDESRAWLKAARKR